MKPPTPPSSSRTGIPRTLVRKAGSCAAAVAFRTEDELLVLLGEGPHGACLAAGRAYGEDVRAGADAHRVQESRHDRRGSPGIYGKHDAHRVRGGREPVPGRTGKGHQLRVAEPGGQVPGDLQRVPRAAEMVDGGTHENDYITPQPVNPDWGLDAGYPPTHTPRLPGVTIPNSPLTDYLTSRILLQKPRSQQKGGKNGEYRGPDKEAARTG